MRDECVYVAGAKLDFTFGHTDLIFQKTKISTHRVKLVFGEIYIVLDILSVYVDWIGGGIMVKKGFWEIVKREEREREHKKNVVVGRYKVETERINWISRVQSS